MSNFLKNTLMTISRQISAILIGLLYTVIIARALGPSGNGMYQLVILLPTMLMTILNLGVGSASVYFIGQKKFDIHTIAKNNSVLGLVLSFISIVLGLLFVLLFGEQYFSTIPLSYVYLTLMVMPFLFLNEYYLVLFQGKQDFKSFNLLALSRQIIALFSVVLFLLAFKIGLVGSIIAFVLGILTQYVITLYLLRKKLNVKILQGSFSKDYLKDSINYGIKAHMSNILSFVNYRADLFIIGFFINPVAVGLYTAAVSIGERLWVVSQAISSVLFPSVSSLEKIEEKNRLTAMISRNVCALSIATGVLFFLFSDLFIYVLFGDQYIESSTVLKILLPGITLFAVDRILSNDLAGRGKPQINMNVSLFTVSLNIILNIILVPIYGINGAAFSTSFTYCLSSVIKVFIFKRETKVPIHQLVLLQKEDLIIYRNILRKVRVRG